eukprot:2526145-Rhodomonas_salina.1
MKLKDYVLSFAAPRVLRAVVVYFASPNDNCTFPPSLSPSLSFPTFFSLPVPLSLPFSLLPSFHLFRLSFSLPAPLSLVCGLEHSGEQAKEEDKEEKEGAKERETGYLRGWTYEHHAPVLMQDFQ